MGVVYADEDVSHDHNSIELRWEGGGFNSVDALGLATLSDLENVVVSSEVVCGAVDDEGKVWEAFDTGAVTGDGSDLGEDLVHKRGVTNKEGSAGVDDSLGATESHSLAADGNVVKSDLPVGVADESVVLEGTNRE
mgnify:CR=1 FL=1